jgi:hypothetical protein
MLQCRLSEFKLSLDLFQFVAEISYFRQDRSNIFTPAFSVTDPFGSIVSPRLQLLGTRLKQLAVCFERVELRNGKSMAASGKEAGNIYQIGT